MGGDESQNCCVMTSCCVIQEQLNIQTRKRIGASGSSVKNVEIPAIRNQFGLINLYFTLTHCGLTLIFSLSSRSSVKAPIIAQNTPSSLFTWQGWPLLTSHAITRNSSSSQEKVTPSCNLCIMRANRKYFVMFL